MRRRRLGPGQIARAVSGAVALATTITGLIFALWPTLKPDEPPATKGATLTNTTVDRISFGQYLERTAQSRSGYRRADLDRQGVLVRFHIDIKGYRNKHLPLQWRLIDARTGDQIAQSQDVSLTPEASEDQGSWPIWVNVPFGTDRRFFVEVELLDDRGVVPLGQLRTDPFAGAVPTGSEGLSLPSGG